MAKKKGRPPAGRDDVTVKLDRQVAFQAKQIAGSLNIPVAELLTETCRASIAKRYVEYLKSLEKKQGA